MENERVEKLYEQSENCQKHLFDRFDNAKLVVPILFAEFWAVLSEKFSIAWSTVVHNVEIPSSGRLNAQNAV